MRPIETLRGIPRCGATNAASTYASPVLRRARWVANRSESKLCAEDVPSGDYSTAVEEKDEDMKMEEVRHEQNPRKALPTDVSCACPTNVRCDGEWST